MNFYSSAYCGLALVLLGSSADCFSYDRNDYMKGPYAWGRMYRQCDGSRQSPINIQTNHAVYGRPFVLRYIIKNVNLTGTLTNTGIFASFVTESGYQLTGVPYHEQDVFELQSFHFHFGRFNGEGFEHTIDGNPYSGEFHMIHYNTKYGSYESAKEFPDGRAVVAVFFQTGFRSDRPRIDGFFQEYLPLIRQHTTEVEVVSSPLYLLPESSDIYTYAGSTTTPPCSENIRWIIHRQPIVLSEYTVVLARSLQSSMGYPQGRFGNFRPLQQLHGRIVETNFIPYQRSLILSPLSLILRR